MDESESLSHSKWECKYHVVLPEEHGRRYAAVEALKIGFGGFAYVARVLGMSRNRRAGGHGQRGSPPHSVPVAVPSASAVLAVVVAKSPNA